MKRTLTALFALALWPTGARAQGPEETPLSEADLAALVGQPATAAPAAPTISQTELDALGLGSSTPSVDKSIQLSGFADFSLGALLVPPSNFWRTVRAGPSHPSFYLGNINIYLSKYLTESLYMLGEVRLSYLPNGSTDYGVLARTSTSASDYNDFGRTLRWGGIEIERFVLDWIAHPRITVRMGQFLTPYGVWNVDHGSPTLIPPRRPWMIGVGWFPERQTGIELFGSVDVSTFGTVGYHLTVSNGTGPVSEYADLDGNKALGGRIYWDYRRLGRLRIGASTYYGRDTNTKTGYTVNSRGTYNGNEQIVSQYDSLGFAGDVLWTYRGIHLQSEWIVHQRGYTDKGRSRSAQILSSEAVPADLVSWGGYLLAGYRLPWFGVMPFLLFERDKTDVYGLPAALITIHGGLNVRPLDVFVFKLSYEHTLITGELGEGQPSRTLQAQVAWAF